MSNWSVERKVRLGFALAILVLGATGSLAFYNAGRVIENNRLVVHTHQVLADVEQTYSTIQDAETSQRGYLLTGLDDYLKPYREAVAKVDSQIEHLRALTSDNPRQQARIKSLQIRADKRIAILENVLQVRRTQGYEAAADLVMAGEGQLAMDSVRALVLDMQTEESRFLQDRARAAEASSRDTLLASAFCVVLVCFLIWLSNRIITSDISERRRTEKALTESEERFRSLSNASRDGVTIHVGGKVLETNRRLAEMFGYETGEVVGMSVLALTPPEQHSLILQKASSGDESPYETVGLRKDGTTFPIEVSGQTVPYQGREACVTTTRDLTEQKRAEAALIETEARLEGIVGSLEDVVWSMTTTGETIYLSPAAEKVYGYPVVDFFNDPWIWLKVVHPEDRERVEKATKGILQTGYVTLTYRIVRPDGEIRWLFDRSRLISDVDGNPSSIDGITTDITEQKRVEDALRASEMKFRLLMEEATDGVIILDRMGNYIETNNTACRLVGYTRDELLKLNMQQLIDPSDLAARPFIEDRRAARNGTLFERVLVRKDGTHVPVEVSANLLDDGSVQAMVRDITERKRAEEALHMMATRDALTGLVNRREMDRVLAEEVARCRRYNRPLSLVMIDIDHFKSVNDRYGHKVGDEVLRWIGEMFQAGLRSTDRAARYGGEEMTLILPETSHIDAVIVAERFREKVAREPFRYTPPGGTPLEIPITISLGVAELPTDALTQDALVIAADQALYRAKRRGRNRVVSHSQHRLMTSGQLVAG